MTGQTIVTRISPVEAVHLSGLVADLRELLAENQDGEDAAVERLAPPAYTDDAPAAAEFRAGTRQDLLDRRSHDALIVETALSSLRDEYALLTEHDTFAERELLIPEAEIDAWLRTLTALRLVIAERLGIADDERIGDDERLPVFDWLGYRLELLVTAADELTGA
ncbi:DUF2017 family protein [Microbacterium sp. XT11]|uniref:DUF2017 family protein n=1 Tax=Microbacterium sp. XT11 TaxID=367477 RepID=UPI000742E896|nr:DUF2017 family protein [Microbacterium sp. XT11]ALX66911.1 hypothetical protein AB663_002431 [Microbacterium sp. XT11]